MHGVPCYSDQDRPGEVVVPTISKAPTPVEHDDDIEILEASQQVPACAESKYKNAPVVSTGSVVAPHATPSSESVCTWVNMVMSISGISSDIEFVVLITGTSLRLRRSVVSARS